MCVLFLFCVAFSVWLPGACRKALIYAAVILTMVLFLHRAAAAAYQTYTTASVVGYTRPSLSAFSYTLRKCYVVVKSTIFGLDFRRLSILSRPRFDTE